MNKHINPEVEILKQFFLKKVNLFSRWISSLSWGKFIIFIILIGIASDNLQLLFTDNEHTWFGALTALFIVFCFGIKILITGKVKAEDAAFEAIEKAHEESLARQVSESRFKVIQSQIDPHFLFNTLAALQYLISSDSKKAQELLQQTVTYLRYILPSGQNRQIVSLGEELKACQAYLEIIKYRLTDRFNYSLEMNNLPINQPIPYTLIQNILDSCIRYGIEPNTETGYIKIYSEKNVLIIENTVVSNDYSTQEVNDIYLKNLINIIKSVGYTIEFDVTELNILKIKISM